MKQTYEWSNIKEIQYREINNFLPKLSESFKDFMCTNIHSIMFDKYKYKEKNVHVKNEICSDLRCI